MFFYILLLATVISIVFGFISGFMVIIFQFKKDCKKITKKQEENTEEINQVNFEEDSFYNDKDNSFKNRVLDMEESWIDMDCSLDGISQETYISKYKASQDEAYHYTKR